MSHELRWAVTDGPDGTAAVVLPDDDASARRLAAQAGGLWCAREAGGCGGELVVVHGRGVPPTLRHTGHTACAFGRGSRSAGPAYDHLRYRPALLAWLGGQGHRPRLCTVPDPGGHTGLHVVVDEVGAALEVQLAPLPDTAWRQRDDGLRRQVGRVTWLHGPDADVTAATEASVRGVSLALRRHDRGLLVGVRDADGRTRWVRLAACRLTADGVEAPGVEEARAVHARRTAERRVAARRAARRATAAGSLAGQLPLWPLPSPL
ncbi:hypothetical protein [Geodermatophilus sp. URMC 62]|uniref:hypothetical protein n=1 Tax=Geodermatophilus sp. URMC 62 TaxID=3423414 RepID=UPI00406CB235